MSNAWKCSLVHSQPPKLNTWTSEGDVGPWQAMAEVARLVFPVDGGTGLLADVMCVAAQRFMEYDREMPPEQLLALKNLLKAAAEYREWDAPPPEGSQNLT